MARDDVFVVLDAECTAESEKGLLIKSPDLDPVWVPKSQVDDDSEVFAKGHTGKLVVTSWIARKLEWID